MQANSDQSTRVLISYSWDSESHCGKVLAFAAALRKDGIEAVIDQYIQAPPEGWYKWMEDQIDKSEFVLIICTEGYLNKFNQETPRGGLGVVWEGAIIRSELYDNYGMNSKFIPVLFSSHDSKYRPRILKGTTYYDMAAKDGYEDLLRRLTKQPYRVPPPIGAKVKLPANKRIMGLLRTEDSSQSHLADESVLTVSDLRQTTQKPPTLFMQIAFFSREIDADTIGALTFTGVHNQKLVTAQTTGSVLHMPAVPDSVNLVLGFASETLRGNHKAKVLIARPNGTELGEFDVEFELPEPELMRPVFQRIELEWDSEGTYWFEVYFQGDLITKVPLQVNYQEVRS